MPGERRRRLQLGFLVVAVAVVAASCSSGPSTPSTTRTTAHRTTTVPPPSTTTTTAPTTSSTLPPVPTSGPLQAGSPIEVPFSADRVTAAESPDGAVFVAPQDPASPMPAVAWVVDGNGPAAVAEHVPNGIAALAADGANFYAATYSNVYTFSRVTGNQDGQWSLPPVKTANSSDNNLVSMAAAGGMVLVSISKGNSVSVYRITPASSAAPHMLLSGLSDAVGSDGSVYYERTDHHLAVLRPSGATAVGAMLAHAPNGLGGGVQYVNAVAGGAVWVSEPAGQGLDAGFSTFDVATLGALGSFSGAVTDAVVDTAAGPLVLKSAGAAASCPQASPTNPSSCVFRIDTHGTASDPVGVGAAVMLLGPGPTVVAADTATNQFELFRLS